MKLRLHGGPTRWLLPRLLYGRHHDTCSGAVTLSVVREACAAVEALMARDPTAALNECELQALLQVELLRLLPNRLEASLSSEVIARGYHPALTIPRVFRELKPDGGRGGKEVDLAVLQDRPQMVRGKLNGAPSKFEPPYAVIIETKIDASAVAALAGRNTRARPNALTSDVGKWRPYIDQGQVETVVSVIMTGQPEAYAGLTDVITIRRSPPAQNGAFQGRDFDPWSQIDAALNEVAEEYRRHPVGCLREKDFESRLFGKLRDADFPRVPFWLPDGSCVAIDPVRAQWSGEWSHSLGRGRRHDLVVLSPTGRSLLAELELKTSHSDSHNWFRKREVEGELQAMQHLIEEGHLQRGRFVMFRYGEALWENDAKSLFSRFPDVEFEYVCA